MASGVEKRSPVAPLAQPVSTRALHADAKVGGKPFRWLIDTGADISIIDLRKVRSWGLASQIIPDSGIILGCGGETEIVGSKAREAGDAHQCRAIVAGGLTSCDGIERRGELAQADDLLTAKWAADFTIKGGM